MKQIVYTKDGVPVYDRQKSHLHKGVLKHLPLALANFTSRSEQVSIFSYTFPHVIGKTYCVEITDKDVVYYKQRRGRKGLSKMVKNREPEPCQTLTVVLKRAGNKYIILTAYIGEPAPPEPYDIDSFKRDPRGYEIAKAESIAFWRTHALIEEY